MTVTIPALEGLKKTIKMKWDGLEWNQYSTEPMQDKLDVFSNIEDVKCMCGQIGNFGFDKETTMCWLDAYNWSLMKRLPVTEDIYQFIAHRMWLVRQGVDKELHRVHIDWTQLKPVWQIVVEASHRTVNFIITYGTETLNFIYNIGGM